MKYILCVIMLQILPLHALQDQTGIRNPIDQTDALAIPLDSSEEEEQQELNTLQQKKSSCASKERCLNDPNCPCWCSVKCGWRQKTPKDRPVYVENDPYGKYCYCRQWDYDHYADNCIYGKNIQPPPGAK